MTFKRGVPRPEKAGRRKGTPNKHTARVRGMLEDAVVALGGLQGLIAWVKERPENESVFWSSMVMRLLPVQLSGAGEDGALVIEVRREELARKLEERGLPPLVFGIDVPTLELEASGVMTNGSGAKQEETS